MAETSQERSKKHPKDNAHRKVCTTGGTMTTSLTQSLGQWVQLAGAGALSAKLARVTPSYKPRRAARQSHRSRTCLKNFESAGCRILAQGSAAINGDDRSCGKRKILDRRDNSGCNLVGRGKSLERRAFQLLISPALVHRLYEIGFDQAGRDRHDANSRGEGPCQ